MPARCAVSAKMIFHRKHKDKKGTCEANSFTSPFLSVVRALTVARYAHSCKDSFAVAGIACSYETQLQTTVCNCRLADNYE